MTKLKKEGRNVCVCVCVLVGHTAFFLSPTPVSTLDQEQKDPMKIITPDYALLQEPLSISICMVSFSI